MSSFTNESSTDETCATAKTSFLSSDSNPHDNNEQIMPLFQLPAVESIELFANHSVAPPHGIASAGCPSALESVLHHAASDANNLSWHLFNPTAPNDLHTCIFPEDADDTFKAHNELIRLHHAMWFLDRRQIQSRSILPRETDSVEGLTHQRHGIASEETTSINPESPLGVAISDLEASLDFVMFYFPLPPTLSFAVSSTALTVGEGVSGSTDTHGIQSDP